MSSLLHESNKSVGVTFTNVREQSRLVKGKKQEGKINKTGNTSKCSKAVPSTLGACTCKFLYLTTKTLSLLGV